MAMQQSSGSAPKGNKFVCDLRRCAVSELTELAKRLRQKIISAVERNGGHLSANLGAVELTIALHRIFDFPKDRLVFDVSHQCYAHKLLTDRDGERFGSIRSSGGYCGYCDISESAHDVFTAGHGGAALSAALGLADARNMLGGNEHIVVVLGDGSLTCGLTQEALQHAAAKKVIVLLNDNGYAIDGTVGAWAKHLSSMDGIKNGCCAFRDTYGMDFIGTIDGHNFDELIAALTCAKRSTKSVLVHAKTQKGRGHRLAELHPEKFHSVASEHYSQWDGSEAHEMWCAYGDALGHYLCQFAEKDDSIVAVTAAMGRGTGLCRFAEKFPHRFFDAAMAEGHALTFSAGLAKGGMRPICAIYSTFAQRAVDNFFHDICLQNLPVVLCLDRAGLACRDGDTHHGLFDIALFSSFPNCSIAQPSSLEEFRDLLRYALGATGPTIIRYGRGCAGVLPVDDGKPQKIELGRGRVLRHGDEISLWALGQRRLWQAMKIAAMLECSGISAEVVDGRFAKPVDHQLLGRSSRCRLIVSLEDHVICGGFGSQLSMALLQMDRRTNFIAIGWTPPIGFAESNGVLEERCGQSSQQLFSLILRRWNELMGGKSSRADKNRTEAHCCKDNVEKHKVDLARVGKDGLAN
jgi:1-deoxy-D-xylulose-5-phosphate synthase